MDTKTGGSAFPWAVGGILDRGMTLRDYFAAAALTGIMAAPVESGWDRNSDAKDIAKASYHIADAMLEARGS
jgi:hypothetical protein